MQIYRLRLAVAAANACPAENVLQRLHACLATFEAGGSRDTEYRALAARSTVVEEKPDTVPDDARARIVAAMGQIDKNCTSDLVADRREAR